ncbi:thioredoxin [Blattabacterium cuenoti]|uniref:thioredoxin n=1 Tax=Blattabacterium cuenoti TaxID=1653831 RepID=UPI00163CC86E|nr:thioredoxin [Blattabacterium cuenoti]
MIQEINDNNFDQLVILDSSLPVLVDFWAPWCAPCRTLSNILEEILIEYEGKVSILKLNVDKNEKTASKYGIRSIPTMFFFKNGIKKDSHIGISSKDEIVKKLNFLIEK